MNPNELSTFHDLLSKTQSAHQTLVLPLSLNRAKIAIVGESLGVDEVSSGEYFVGKAGKLFNKLLREAGIIRSICHITNVVKVQPPGNRVSRLPEVGLSRDDFIPYLTEELQHVKPKIIVAVGRHAMEVLTGNTGVTKWRGSSAPTVLPRIDAETLITLHPSYLQRGQMHLYPYVRADFKRSAELAYGIRQKSKPTSKIVDPTISQALEYLHKINESSSETCLDIETAGRQIITCIGWSSDENNAICIPFRYKGLKNRWSKGEQIMLIHAMKQIFDNPNILKIGQNIHYDLHHLLPLLGFPREPLFDTMWAHSLIHPDARHDLGFIMSVYTDMNYHKDDFKDWEAKKLPHDNVLWQYNADDVIGTHRSKRGLMCDLIEYDLYDFFTGYVMPFRRVLFEMEYRGVRVDTKMRTEWAERVENEELPDVLHHISELTGVENLNPNSSQQVGSYLASLGLPIQRTKLGNYTVKEEKLEELYARFPQHKRIMELIICARKLKAKTLGTYLTAPLSQDGRLRTSYGIGKTGRLKSRSNHRGEGTNLQNQPKRLRRYYIPEEGHVFLCPDLEQAEAFDLVYQMEARELKQRMKSGEKIHAVVAERIDGKKISELTPERYRDIKATVYGSNYKAGIRKFATIIGKTVAEAKVLQDKYLASVPELPKYHKWVEDTINNTRILTNAHGRIRRFTGFIDDKVLRSAIAQLPQSDVADIINKGILGLWLIKPNDIHLLIQVHDEVVISLSPKRVTWFKPYIKAHLETLRSIEIKGDILTIPCDIGETKDNWYGK